MNLQAPGMSELKEQLDRLDLSRLPRHVAMIMDGNGRWAKARGLERSVGHYEGVKSVRRATELSSDLGIEFLTLYAFSTENWNRPQREVDILMHLIGMAIQQETPDLVKNNVHLRLIGDIERMPKEAWDRLHACEVATQHCDGLTLTLALSYSGRRELTRAEYIRLVEAAEREGNQRLSLVLQTICATGIRVSELRFITAEAVSVGRAEIFNKGKRRVVFLPDKLQRLLKKYLREQKKTAGAVFTTRTGKPLDRSNIWRDMKKLCESANVEPGKVFPHNLRHLFARTYYSLEKDLSRLADILGHSSVNTTRIYTVESGTVHAQQVARLGLVLTT